MKILHLQAGNLTIGAARGALWLHQALVKANVNSEFLIQQGQTQPPAISSLPNNKLFKVRRILGDNWEKRRLDKYENKENRIFSINSYGFDITQLPSYRNSDIIHFHWINNGMISLSQISKINKPIVWTFRDMWPFTGGCHYSLSCNRYELGCGSCVQLKSTSDNDLSRYIIQKKLQYFKTNIHPVAISQWLKDCALSSTVFKNKEIRVIPNGVDLEAFKPIDKELAKKVLDLPNKKIVLTVAQDINDFYKGFDKIQEAIKLLGDDYFFLFLGRVNESKLPKVDCKSFGFLQDNLSLNLIYSAADVFVAPSIQEAFGKTLIEAMACGTPVVCFDATGPKDIVEHKVNGYKAVAYDSNDLSEGIKWVTAVQDYSLGINARKHVEELFDIDKIALKYKELYCEILK